MRHIIITGAGGLVATELIFRLLNQTDAHLYLLSTHVDIIGERYKEYENRVDCFTLQSFADFTNKTKVKYDYCIHTAFSRTSSGNQIVASIDYQRALLFLLKELDLGVFVNISSQSVYGKISKPLWTENAPLDPDHLYAMGKYFSEVLTQQILEGSNIKWTNVRLCSVCEKARFVRVFVQNVIDANPILLTAPDQQCSFIDVQDAADALIAFIKHADNIHLHSVYNLGSNIINTVGEIAYLVKSIAEKKYGIRNVSIVEQRADNHSCVGMDATLFMRTFVWRPCRNMEDMIIEMFEMLLYGNEHRYPVSFKIVYNL